MGGNFTITSIENPTFLVEPQCSLPAADLLLGLATFPADFPIKSVFGWGRGFGFVNHGKK
jgi:hypothetical protein